jgi:hypothetical protein
MLASGFGARNNFKESYQRRLKRFTSANKDKIYQTTKSLNKQFTNELTCITKPFPIFTAF